MNKAKHSPGAVRAAKEWFRSMCPVVRVSQAESYISDLAEIIDRETAAPDLLEAAREVVDSWESNDVQALEVDLKDLRGAIAKATGGE